MPFARYEHLSWHDKNTNHNTRCIKECSYRQLVKQSQPTCEICSTI